MRFGLMQLVSGVGDRSPAEIYRDNLELVVLADELGFDCAWVAEHHFSDYGLVPNTLQYLAAAAVRTERIRLGAAVVVTTLHNPIRVAEEIGFLDQLSGGRIEVGVGRGYQPREFEAFGRDPEDSREIFDDSIAFLRRAWSAGGPFDWDGPSLSGRGIEIVPQPLQQPHPPLWLACVSQSTFEKAGQDGWQIMTSPNFTPVKVVRENFEVYTKALAGAGHDPSGFELPIMQMVYAGADEDSAYDEPQEPCMGYFQKLSSLLPTAITAGDADSYEQFRKTQRKLADLRYDYLFENSSVMFGSSERLIERIRRLQDEIGLTYLVGLFNFGTLNHEKAKESLRRFATEVMPAFRC